jgi:hypothetical protein
MVVESTLPVASGLAFTVESYSIVAGLLALAGGALAIIELQIRRRFLGRAAFVGALRNASFVVYVVAAASTPGMIGR